MNQYSPKPDVRRSWIGSNYAAKCDLKEATGFGTSKLAVKPDWTSLKAQVNTIDVNRLEIVPVDLSQLNNIIGKCYC